jgi:uncharacterized delta-60 repeat protein
VVSINVAPVQSAIATPQLSVSSALLSNATVNAILVQPDQQLVLLGSFSNTFGFNTTVLRVNRRGLLDPDFEFGGLTRTEAAGGALQDDGRIVVSERRSPLFTPSGFLRRLRSDGSHDPTFQSFSYDDNSYPGGPVFIDPLGNVIARTRSLNVARLSPAGTMLNSWGMTSLDAIAPSGTNFLFGNRNGLFRTLNNFFLDDPFKIKCALNSNVFALAVQPDGRFLAAGAFTHAGRTNAGSIARFFPDGTLDTSFRAQPDAVESNFVVRAMVLQRDGKIIIGGMFTRYNGVPRNCLARLHPDGSLDTSFDPGAGPTGGVAPRIKALALGEDGTLYVGGAFTHFNGIPRHSFSALYNNPQLSSPRYDAQSFSASFVSIPDRTFILESAPSPTANWTPVDSVVGDGSDKSLTDNASSPSQKFYRIRVE